MCLFGRASPRATIFLMSTATINFLGTMVIFEIMDHFEHAPSDGVFTLNVVAWVFLGLFAGYLLHFRIKYGYMMLGLMTGAFISHIILI